MATATLSIKGSDSRIELRDGGTHTFGRLGAEDLRMLLLDALLEKACDPEYNEETNRAIFDKLAAMYGVGRRTWSLRGGGAEYCK